MDVKVGTIKKAECRRIDAFELWCWRRLFRVSRTAKTPILWPPDLKSWLTGKDPDAGKDWEQKKGTTEDKTVGWHRRLNGHGFGWTLGVADGQGGRACCGSWGHKESDTTEWLNSFSPVDRNSINTRNSIKAGQWKSLGPCPGKI